MFRMCVIFKINLYGLIKQVLDFTTLINHSTINSDFNKVSPLVRCKAKISNLLQVTHTLTDKTIDNSHPRDSCSRTIRLFLRMRHFNLVSRTLLQIKEFNPSLDRTNHLLIDRRIISLRWLSVNRISFSTSHSL